MDALMYEPISPELVLVSPELRWRAISELWELEAASSAAPPEVAVLPRDRRSSLAAQLLLYIGWQALTGIAFGVGAFLVFVALILLKPFFTG